MSVHCPCEFGPRHELGTFSAEWHRQHRDHHLAVFPDVDEGTKRNLADAIEWAEKAQTTHWRRECQCEMAPCINSSELPFTEIS